MTATESMEAQLAELYREKEVLNSAFPDIDVKGLIALARSVQSQLDALIGDQLEQLLHEREVLSAAFPGLGLQDIIELARAEWERRESASAFSNDPIASSFENQLQSLYSEREELEFAFPGRDARGVVTEIQEKIRLLERFYSQQS